MKSFQEQMTEFRIKTMRRNGYTDHEIEQEEFLRALKREHYQDDIPDFIKQVLGRYRDEK